MKKNKILVIGGCGFMGSHLVDELIGANYNVTVLDINKIFINKKAKYIIGDIMNKSFLDKTINKYNIIYNFAGLADIKECDLNPKLAFDLNVIGNLNILSSILKSKIKIERYVFASSLYVYSKFGGIYRCSKQASEILIDEFCKQNKIKYTILRFGSLYGQRAGPNNTIQNLISQIMNKKIIEYWGGPNNLREFIHVNDAARACIDILSKNFINKNCTITGNNSIDIYKLINLIQEITNKKVKTKFNAKADSGHYNLTPYSFVPKIGIKYIPQQTIDLGEGLLKLVDENFNNVNKK